MDNPLYFIKLLAGALQAPDPHSALKKAQATITELGRQPEYKQGYQQYLRFMELVCSELGLLLPETDTQLGFNSEDQLGDLEVLLKDFEPEERRPCIVVKRDGDQLATLTIEDGRIVGIVESAKPGNYSVGLDTGRNLWQGRLSGQDLIWREAFPDEPLPLAADTDQESPPVSREIVLIPDELVLKVIPGRRQGRLEIIYLR